jgi:hypothetical protein
MVVIVLVPMVVAVPGTVGMHVLMGVPVRRMGILAIDFHFAVAATTCRTHRKSSPIAHSSESHPPLMQHAKGQLVSRPPSPLSGGYQSARFARL